MTPSKNRPTSTTRRGEHDVLRRRRTTQLYRVPESSAGLLETARLAATLLGYSIAQINLFDDNHQLSLVDWDADAPCTTARPTEGRSVVPRTASMCPSAVLAGALLAVDDLCADVRYAHLPGVQAGVARSYVGVPIRSRESEIIGTLCVMDRVVRHATTAEKQSLTDFARSLAGCIPTAGSRVRDVSCPAPRTAISSSNSTSRSCGRRLPMWPIGLGSVPPKA